MLSLLFLGGIFIKNFKLYYIDDNYIEYLRKFETKVAYNKNATRPYVGVIYTYNNINYFAPLSSPKPKHMKISNKAIDVFKIQKGELGIINLNNSIPVPENIFQNALPLVKDEKYKILLEKQLTFLNDNKVQLLNKANSFQNRIRKCHVSPEIKSRCCDFKLLEEKSKEWTIL